MAGRRLVQRFIQVDRVSGSSVANTAQTVNSATGTVQRLLLVTLVLSASGTTTATITLDSGAGAAFDAVLGTIVLAPGTEGTFLPAADVIISTDDRISVTATAGGVGIVTNLAIYTEVLGK